MSAPLRGSFPSGYLAACTRFFRASHVHLHPPPHFCFSRVFVCRPAAFPARSPSSPFLFVPAGTLLSCPTSHRFRRGFVGRFVRPPTSPPGRTRPFSSTLGSFSALFARVRASTRSRGASCASIRDRESVSEMDAETILPKKYEKDAFSRFRVRFFFFDVRWWEGESTKDPTRTGRFRWQSKVHVRVDGVRRRVSWWTKDRHRRITTALDERGRDRAGRTETRPRGSRPTSV